MALRLSGNFQIALALSKESSILLGTEDKLAGQMLFEAALTETLGQATPAVIQMKTRDLWVKTTNRRILRTLTTEPKMPPPKAMKHNQEIKDTNDRKDEACH